MSEDGIVFNPPIIIKENNRTSEQTFFLSIVPELSWSPNYFQAITLDKRNLTDIDFLLDSDDITFFPDVQEVSVNVTIYDDTFAEGNESFHLRVSCVKKSSAKFDFPIRSFSHTTIIIYDNDGKMILLF